MGITFPISSACNGCLSWIEPSAYFRTTYQRKPHTLTTMIMQTIIIKNNQSVPLSSIPELSYGSFLDVNTGFLADTSDRHCVNYYGVANGKQLQLICCIADDVKHVIHLSSCKVQPTDVLRSFTARLLCFEKFEREIHE